ncbi:hypothetical protein BC827DRAFT_1124072 [Russula dissimulans]|nr:hypothetical protein BC827DRAFT_1124072 [Russula dissimulans]
MSPATSSLLPAPHIGYLLLAASALLLAVGTHAVLFSALFHRSAGGGDREGIIDIINAVLDALARDTHYKYLALFSVPVCAYFVIANWVGWQFFRNS